MFNYGWLCGHFGGTIDVDHQRYLQSVVERDFEKYMDYPDGWPGLV